MAADPSLPWEEDPTRKHEIAGVHAHAGYHDAVDLSFPRFLGGF
jgi:hypothetical protein